MPPASSIGTSGTVTTRLSSAVSENQKSLRNFEIDNDQSNTFNQVLDGIDFDKSDICLVSVPAGFPTEKLSEIPIDGDESFIVQDETTCYTVETCTSHSKKIIPIPRKKSGYRCRAISKSLSITKSMTDVESDRRKFLPRPQFPEMSKNLIERFCPYGWQNLEQGIIEDHCILKPSSSKKRHRKKTLKRKLENDDQVLDDKAMEASFVQPTKRKKIDFTASYNVSQHCSDDIPISAIGSPKEILQERARKEERRATKAAKKAKKEAKRAKRKKE